MQVILNGTIDTDHVNIDELSARLWRKSGMSLRRRLRDPGSMKISIKRKVRLGEERRKRRERIFSREKKTSTSRIP